jgi:hypothetical protein
MLSVGSATIAYNVFGLGEGGDFTIPNAFGIDAENQTLINHKCVCGAPNRHFCQTRVMWRFSYFAKKSFIILSVSFGCSSCGVCPQFRIIVKSDVLIFAA